MPLQTHQNILNSNFLNTAYGVSALGQKLPPFTTSDFALLPFKPSTDGQLRSDTQTWSAVTKIYSTSLECEPAVISQGRGETRVFDNGRGCNNQFAFSLLERDSFLIQYIGYFNDAVVGRSLDNPNCTKEHEDNFLAICAPKPVNQTTDVDYENMTALFCRPRYHVQEAIVTVNASDGRVDSHKPTGPIIQLPTRNNIFNTTHFEYVVGAGVPPLRQRANRADTFRLEPYPSVAKYNLSWPLTNAVGFGVFLHNGTIEDLKNPKMLSKTFENVHKLLFAIAFNTLIQPSDPIGTTDIPQAGTIMDTLGAITIERTISLIVEAAFGLVVIMAVALWWISYKRPSRLLDNPATISSVMSHIQDSILRDDLADVSSQTFRLTTFGTGNRSRVFLTRDQPISILSSRSTEEFAISGKESIDQQTPIIRPLELRMFFGLLFISAISVALGTVIFLEVYSVQRNGKLDLCLDRKRMCCSRVNRYFGAIYEFNCDVYHRELSPNRFCYSLGTSLDSSKPCFVSSTALRRFEKKSRKGVKLNQRKIYIASPPTDSMASSPIWAFCSLRSVCDRSFDQRPRCRLKRAH